MNRRLPLLIDLLFCIVLMPFMIYLLPLDRWLENNTGFVVLLFGWLFLVYLINRNVCVPFFFKDKRHVLCSLVIFFLMVLLTYALSTYQLDFPREHFRHPRLELGMNKARFKMNQQAVWFLFMVVSSFSLAVGLLNELFRQSMEKQLIEFEKKKAELALYKAQINPHFLFNTLNTLYGLLLMGSDRTIQAFTDFIGLMKYMYANGVTDKVSLETELEYIRQYIELQKHRLNELTHVSFSCLLSAADKQLEIAPMLLITFVENAFKHGVSSRSENHIDIRAEVENKQLLFQVENLLVQKLGNQPRKGIGLENCRKRLDLLYAGKYQLTEEKSEHTFKIILQIKLAE